MFGDTPVHLGIFFLVQIVANPGLCAPSEEFVFSAPQLRDWLFNRKQGDYFASAKTLAKGSSLIVPGKIVGMTITRP